MPRILIVEDTESTVTGCIQLFSQDGFDVQHCRSYKQALVILKSSSKFDVALIDVLIPRDEKFKADPDSSDRGLGFVLADALRELQPTLPIVMTSSYNDVKRQYEELVRKWGQGICFVAKDYHHEQLNAVWTAIRGKSKDFEDLKEQKTREEWFLDDLHPLAHDIVIRACEKLQQDPTILTETEKEVAHFAKFDLTSQGLAKALQKERDNVHKHLQNIYLKLNITRAELLDKPFESGTILGLIVKLYEIREGTLN